MGNTDLSADLNNVAKFVATSQYPSQMNILNSEWGAVNNIRFLLSSIGYVAQNASGLGRNVYSLFVTGMESYGIVEQDGYSASFIYLPPQFSGPLAMNASVGYKMAMVPRLLNDLWIINMRCTKAN
jgi:N4-gp56 family major capsid protein